MDRDRERDRDRDRDSSRRDRSRSRDRDRSRLPTTTSGMVIFDSYITWMTTLYLQLPQKNDLYSIHTLCVGRSLQGGGSSHSFCSIREVGTIIMMMMMMMMVMMMRHVVHFEQMVQSALGCLLMHVSAHSMGT